MSHHRQLQAAGRRSNSPLPPSSSSKPPLPPQPPPAQPLTRMKKLKWHALVDSGMGRLGFKPEPMSNTITATATAQKEEEEEEVGEEEDVVIWKGESTSTNPTTSAKKGNQRDTVDIIKEMYDMEVHDSAPI
eukprot:10664383-Ditylum_brightwellii.AAC.1